VGARDHGQEAIKGAPYDGRKADVWSRHAYQDSPSHLQSASPRDNSFTEMVVTVAIEKVLSDVGDSEHGFNSPNDEKGQYNQQHHNHKFRITGLLEWKVEIPV
jgi:hypothetical protein